jgi:hypothetical protein
MGENDIKLLEECCSGCRMAINSMDQVQKFISDNELQKLILSYKKKHEKLEADCTETLKRNGEQGKNPNVFASSFSWISTEIKLSIMDSSHEVAKIMMDGCNMGIQSISENINKYSGATVETVCIAKELVRIEEDFMKDLKPFL